MKTQDLLNITQRDLMKMTEKELKKIVSTTRSTSRKRYERLVESEVYSPAMESLRKSREGQGSMFPTVAGMDKTTLINEYKLYKHFLGMKTSTVKGARKVEEKKKEMIVDVSERSDFSDDEVKQIFNMVDELTDVDEYALVMSSTDRISAIAREYKQDRTASKDEIIAGARERLKNEYEKQHTTEPLPPSAYFKEYTD